MMELDLSRIRTDGGTQPRLQMDRLVVKEYAEEMTRGVVFPPITVFFDGEDYWLADGFHRLAAAKMAGSSTIIADVRQGKQREAILCAVGVNATHGLRRTNADKRRAVEILLVDSEWNQWSDREIARRCAVSDRFVNSIRKKQLSHSASNDSPVEGQRKVCRNGTIYTLNTDNIGKNYSREALVSSTNQPSLEVSQGAFVHQVSDNKNKNIIDSSSSEPLSGIEVLSLDFDASKNGAESFAIKSKSMNAEVICSPKIMAELLQYVRDSPGFIRTVLRQAKISRHA